MDWPKADFETADGRVRLYRGDCLAVLPTLPADSVTALVTDPPAGIGFMGKAWDSFPSGGRGVCRKTGSGNPCESHGFARDVHWQSTDKARDQFIAFLSAVARECLRIVVPGGYGLVWAIPRTSHWTATALEDAGWEIRDVIVHLTGQGFPKSYNVNKALRESGKICQCGEDGHCGNEAAQAESDLPDVRPDLSASTPDQGADQVSVLRPEVLREVAGDRSENPGAHAENRADGKGGLDDGRAGELPSADERPEQPFMEGRGNVQEEQGELRRPEVRPVPRKPKRNGKARRVRDGASAGDGGSDPPMPQSDRGCSSPRPQDAEQPAGESGTLAEQRDAQNRGVWPTCHRCGKPIVPDGLGTALKPAAEHWILVRKPLAARNVADNLLRYGTGPLNIDGCRIEANGRPLIESKSEPSVSTFGDGLNGSRHAGTTDAGRWPANVTLDEEAAAMLDEQAGELSSGVMRAGQKRSTGGGYMANFPETATLQDTPGDSGGASRFFYVAKADRSDRERGNDHPTVKSTALMRWLVRLVTPEGGIVLDPFAGSGSTGKAAIREGCQFVGIEREERYYRTAVRRMERALSEPELFTAATAPPPPQETADLFGEQG